MPKVDEMQNKVEDILEKIRPSLMMDGGNVELLGVDKGVVKVRLTGGCAHCSMSNVTLKMGIERLLQQEIPGIKEVVNVADEVESGT
jgi:Fe-S cluster biogenesis protein NfuA